VSAEPTPVPTPNEQVIADWYRALNTVDLELFGALHAPDCVYNVSGHTPISGRCDMRRLTEEVLPQVFGRLDLAEYRLAVKWSIMCSDGRRVVGMMEGDGPGTNGKRYDQRYLHVFELRDGLITEVWEFFDTQLAAEVLFYDPERSPTRGRLDAFAF
jgi:uncharacterized protein